ncbi:MAG: hypothetical protein Q9170_004854 [Blastenia crenularia]
MNGHHQEMQIFSDKSPEHTQIEIEGQSSYDRDRDDLARLGKKQVLKRNFGFMSMLGFSCTIMVTWEGILVLFLAGLQNGGPAGLIYGFIIVWIGTLCVFTTLAELASMAPTAGGQYYWVAMLAPPAYRRFLSYITGWLTVAGWQAFAASGGYLTGTIFQGLIVLNKPDYNFQRWHGTLLFWATILVAVIVNTLLLKILPKIESIILIIHVLGFFGIMIPLVYMAPHGSAADVFTVFVNGGGWQTTGLSFFVGMTGNVFAFLGADAAIHMSEEIANASVNVPRSMMVSIMLNGVLGFAMLVAVLFCLGNIEDVIQTPTGYPFIAIFSNAVQSQGGAAVMVAVVALLGICATIAFVATSSRMTWSFARDHGLPFWRYLSKVEPHSSIPLISILTTVIISCLLALINIGSSIAFNDVISLTINGLYASYLIASVLLLYRRLTNSITTPTTYETNPKLVTEAPGQVASTINLTWGPFHVPGVLGVAVNVVGIAYMVVIIFFSFWPPTVDPTAKTMNYSVLVTGFVLLFSVVYYFAYARRVYKGPLVEI